MIILFAQEIKYKAEVIAAERTGFLVLDFSLEHFFRVYSKNQREGNREHSHSNFHLNPFKDLLPVFDTPEPTLLRGGVLNPFVYEALYWNLRQQHNIWLINDPDHYLATCSVVNHYEKIKEHAPTTIWTDKIVQPDSIIQVLSNTFAPHSKLMIKDFMRSAKYERNRLYDIGDSCNEEEVMQAIDLLAKSKNGVLEGGVVFSEYTELTMLHHTPLPFTKQHIYEEYRLWFFCGELLLKTGYFEEMPDYSDQLKMEELAPFLEIAQQIESNFFVIDIARCKTGNSLKIIELNPGQTSGINYHNHHQFYEKLYGQINKR